MVEDLQCCPKFSRDIQSIKYPKECLQFPQQLVGLHAIAVSPSGTYFVSDYSSHKILVFNEQREYIRSFSNKGHEEEQLTEPFGIAVDSDGLVYVASLNNRCIHVFREDGTLVLQFGIGQLNAPVSLTIYNQLLYIADFNDHRISVYDLQGEHICCIGEEGSGPGQFMCPTRVAFSPDGYMYVTDFGNDRVQVFTANGQYSRELGQDQLNCPTDILITSDGDVLVADFDSNSVAVFSTHENSNNLVHSIEVESPRCVTINKEGSLLVIKDNGRGVVVF